MDFMKQKKEESDREKELPKGNQPSVQDSDKHEERVEDMKEAVSEGGKEAYGKHGSNDENHPLTQESEVEALVDGADDLSSSVISDKLRERIAGEQAAQANASLRQESDGDTSVYSSHPISRYRVGRFQFEQGTLRLKGDDVGEFEEIMRNQPPREQARVKKIDVEAANVVARNFAKSQGSSRTRGVDTAGSGQR